MYKHTFLIVYPGGAYGTFLDWCINWFSGTVNDSELPFAENGSSHLWVGNPAGDVVRTPSRTLENYLRSNEETFTMRTHMMSDDAFSLAALPARIISYKLNFRKIVIINNNPKLHLLTLHNMLTKTKAMSYNRVIKDAIAMFKNQFGAKEPIPTWQLREILSYWHGRHHHYYKTCYQPIDDVGIINIDLFDLCNNFEVCLIRLFKSLDLPMIRLDQITTIKNIWISQQKFMLRDQLCQDIISATLGDQQFYFGTAGLHLLDEAFIQWQLRDIHGMDLLCDNLNVLPPTSQKLREKLISYNK